MVLSRPFCFCCEGSLLIIIVFAQDVFNFGVFFRRVVSNLQPPTRMLSIESFQMILVDIQVLHSNLNELDQGVK